jgi:hypothetical protein
VGYQKGTLTHRCFTLLNNGNQLANLLRLLDKSVPNLGGVCSGWLVETEELSPRSAYGGQASKVTTGAYYALTKLLSAIFVLHPKPLIKMVPPGEFESPTS